MKRSRPRFLVPVLLLASLPACGIQPTGVVDGGRAAGGVNVYYVLDGRLHPVARRISAGDLETSIGFLFIGPDRADRAAGITTAIPRSAKGSYQPAGQGITIVLNIEVASLTTLALQQIACTVSVAWRGTQAGRAPAITLMGPQADRKVPPCQERLP